MAEGQSIAKSPLAFEICGATLDLLAFKPSNIPDAAISQ